MKTTNLGTQKTKSSIIVETGMLQDYKGGY